MGWKPCMSGSEIIATLSLLIVVGLGLCKVWIRLNDNSIHTITHEFYQYSTHTPAHTHTTRTKHIHTYINRF